MAGSGGALAAGVAQVDIGHSVGWGVALAAFAGGLVSFFSPCVAPLVPGYIGYLSGASLRPGAASAMPAPTPPTPASRLIALRRSPAFAPSLLFVGGFSSAFIALGLLSASFGGLLLAYRPVMETVAGIVMLAMGAFLLDLLPKTLTEVLLREGRLHVRPQALAGLGLGAPFVLGVVFAAGWTPCIGPVLAVILTYVGASGSPAAGGLLLGVYSLGFALPFLAVGLGWSASLGMLGFARRYGPIISKISGVALLAVGLLYLSGHAELFAQWAPRLAAP